MSQITIKVPIFFTPICAGINLKKVKYRLRGLFLIKKLSKWCTPQPLYNTVHYNTVLDITQISVDHLGLIFLFKYTVYPCYNTDWIANTEIN